VALESAVAAVFSAPNRPEMPVIVVTAESMFAFLALMRAIGMLSALMMALMIDSVSIPEESPPKEMPAMGSLQAADCGGKMAVADRELAGDDDPSD
jgi:hypothetical protein